MIHAKDYVFAGKTIPLYMCQGLMDYIQKGIMPGHFLTAVLENDLLQAFQRADNTNLETLQVYVAYLYNHAPMTCWGSKENVRTWVDSFHGE